MIPQGLIDWIVELIQRFGMKSPKFFQKLGLISNILMLLSGIPYAIHQAELIFHFTSPEWLIFFSNKLVIGIGIGLKIASKLTIKTTPVAQTEEGEAVTVLDKTKLPFTTKTEAKEVEQTVPPPPVIPEVKSPSEIKP